MAPAQVVFDGSEGSGLPAYSPPCRERRIPGLGATWVHGYTAAEAAEWLDVARDWSGAGRSGEPPPAALDMVQMVYVCRTAPGGDECSFRVYSGGVRQAYQQLSANLPGRLAATIAHESDLLALDGYLPADDDRGGADEGARLRLGERLADPRFWSSLDYLVLKLYGHSLREHRRPLGEVLTALRLDRERQEALFKALGPLAALAKGGCLG